MNRPIAETAALMAHRWQTAIAQLATTHPEIAAECLQTLARLTQNVESFVQEAAAAHPTEATRP